MSQDAAEILEGYLAQQARSDRYLNSRKYKDTLYRMRYINDLRDMIIFEC